MDTWFIARPVLNSYRGPGSIFLLFTSFKIGNELYVDLTIFGLATRGPLPIPITYFWSLTHILNAFIISIQESTRISLLIYTYFYITIQYMIIYL